MSSTTMRSAMQTAPVLATLAMLAALGCGSSSGKNAANVEARLEVRATSDDGKPLSRVALARGKRSLGETPADGRMLVKVSGPEGQAVSIGVGCPSGFVEQTEPRLVRLARTRSVGQSGPAKVLLDIVCQRKQRDVVLAVRATGGAGLPVTINGERAALTDADGNAHVLLKVDRSVRTLEVDLDTRKRKDLSGQGSRRVLELGPSDTVLVVDQRFTQAAPAVRASGRPTAPTHHVPVRID